MLTYGALPHRSILYADVPLHHRSGLWGNVKSKSLIQCGEVKPSGNEPYCYTEEKQCAGRICRVLASNESSSSVMVVRDDGTVWKIKFEVFEEIFKLDVVDAQSVTVCHCVECGTEMPMHLQPGAKEFHCAVCGCVNRLEV